MSINLADVIGSPGSVPGDFESTANAFVERKKKVVGAGEASVQGDCLQWDSVAKATKKNDTTLANQKGPFGVNLEDCGDNDTSIAFCNQPGTIHTGKAGAGLTAGCYLRPSVVTRGRWDMWVQGTHTEDLKLAQYTGKPIVGEGDGSTFATDAIAGDTIRFTWIGGA